MATLRSEACRDPTTVTCQGWSGSCRPAARRSAPRRAAHNVRFHNTRIRRIHHPSSAPSSWASRMKLPADAILTMAVYTAEPGSPSHDALDLLASWTAMVDQAEAANVVEGL